MRRRRPLLPAMPHERNIVCAEQSCLHTKRNLKPTPAEQFFFHFSSPISRSHKKTNTPIETPHSTNTTTLLQQLLHIHHIKYIMNSTAAQPIATASSSALTPFGGQVNSRHVAKPNMRRQWTHSPVVLAMITNNRLTNCRDVNQMMQECLASESDDRVCQTAASYYDMCIKGGSQE